jgi:tRNA(Glu) U13 pseudouridine synthase TruD
VQPKETDVAAGVDEHGGYITVAFTLPAGSFATTLLREIMKPGEASSSRPAKVESVDEQPPDDSAIAHPLGAQDADEA